MRILWDLRLCSYKYREKGVGKYVFSVIKSALENGILNNNEIYIWAEKQCVPSEFYSFFVKWIPYNKTSWKKDLFFIPYLVLKYRINIFHYWISCGPITKIGMGIFNLCKTCITIHDLGVKYITNDNFLDHVRNTKYWKIQNLLANFAHCIICNSEKTKNEVEKNITLKNKSCYVIYPPIIRIANIQKQKKEILLTLSGMNHKNLQNVIKAFFIFSKDFPLYKLVICGDSEKNILDFTDKIYFEKMDKYEYYLDNATALIFCSTYEGLGIPPLEAMAHGCPLVLSNIPSLLETCKDFARFVNPFDEKSICEGIIDVCKNLDYWIIKSINGFERYNSMSKNAGKKLIEIYNHLVK
jgi:glycosyltransferase involved in cell wall biosynthesis